MPAITSRASEPRPMPTDCQRSPIGTGSAPAGDMKATMASSGTISMSSNSSTATIFCPCGRLTSPRSLSSCMTMAVEVSTKPIALMKDTPRGNP
jgi:hypothetical protein